LNPNGRGGVIVPEGIIFQSGNAYKKLRKMLIENSLYVVVSLPAGVFNPYSGVKTSILFLNKNLAKKTDKILFVKVNHDGFGLGAQRRKIKENDLPLALDIIKKYKQSIVEGKEIEFNLNEAKLANIVKKEKIAESGDYNLSGDRYKEAVVYNGKWDFVELLEIADIGSGNSAPQGEKYFKNGKYPFYRTSDVGKVHISTNLSQSNDYVNELAVKEKKMHLFPKNTILFPKSGASTFLNHRVMISKEGYVSSHLATIVPNEEKICPLFLFYLLLKINAKTLTPDQAYPSLKISKIQKIKIPLPPLEIQEQIIAELDSYQKIIDGAKQVVENYKPTFKIDPEWETVEIGSVCEFNPKKSEVRNLADDLKVSFVPMADLNEHRMLFNIKQIKNKAEVYKGYTYFKENDVLLARVTPCFENGKSGIARNLKNNIGFGSSEYFVYRAKEEILSEWIYYFVSSLNFIESGKNHMTGTGGLQRLTKDYATKYKIPLPTLEVQHQIVAQITREQKIIDANKELITIFENKIKDKIANVWGE
jgi:type I restriction enzyme M protein